MPVPETNALPEFVKDSWGRPLRALRVSVTDRCNLRCQYCMPEEEYVWLPRETLLTFEEIVLLTDLFADHGVNKVRITGGEPLLRKDLAKLIRMIRQNSRIQDIAVTTNGVLLGEQAQSLFDAGLHRITVSLDTLKPERFKALTRRDTLGAVLVKALADFDIIEALVLHRYGPIEIGENIVLIIVGAEHRADAFKACQWCIDELKKITPIWKMEYTQEGEVWVEEHP